MSQRFGLAASFVCNYDVELSGQVNECDDYTCHNEVIFHTMSCDTFCHDYIGMSCDILLQIMELLLSHVTSSHDKIKMLQHNTMCNNPQWVYRLLIGTVTIVYIILYYIIL